jgi:peptide/nickel transport system substrate-binding protein
MAARVANDPALRCHADDVPGNFTRYLSVEQMVAPFDNVHCRRAVQYAVDKAALVPVWGGPLQASVTSTMLTPNIATYDPGFDPYPVGPAGTGDLARAREELRLCGHPNGFTTRLATMDSGAGYVASTVEVAALAKIGITVTLVPFPFTEYYPWISATAHIRQFQIGLEILAWGPDFPTDYGFWESLVDSRNITAEGNTNYPELRDPAVQADLALATSSTDTGAQLTAYRDLAQRVMSDSVYVPLVSLKSLYYRNPHLTNVYVQPAFGAYDLMALGVN